MYFQIPSGKKYINNDVMLSHKTWLNQYSSLRSSPPPAELRNFPVVKVNDVESSPYIWNMKTPFFGGWRCLLRDKTQNFIQLLLPSCSTVDYWYFLDWWEANKSHRKCKPSTRKIYIHVLNLYSTASQKFLLPTLASNVSIFLTRLISNNLGGFTQCRGTPENNKGILWNTA